MYNPLIQIIKLFSVRNTMPKVGILNLNKLDGSEKYSENICLC